MFSPLQKLQLGMKILRLVIVGLSRAWLAQPGQVLQLLTSLGNQTGADEITKNPWSKRVF